MTNQDKQRFLQQINGAASVYRQQVDAVQLDIFWKILIEYSIDQVCLAFDQHIRVSKFFPTPAEIIANIPGSTHHYAADEAWAIVLKSFDESETVVMTSEMLTAKSEVQDVFDSGDTIGARMAFRAAYERIVRTAPAPRWEVSLGHDPHRRFDAVIKAVNAGLLPPRSEQKYLESVRRDAGPIAGLLTGKIENPPTDNLELKKRWQVLKGAINAGIEYAENQKSLAKEDEKVKRQDFERNREEQLAQVKIRLVGA